MHDDASFANVFLFLDEDKTNNLISYYAYGILEEDYNITPYLDPKLGDTIKTMTDVKQVKNTTIINKNDVFDRWKDIFLINSVKKIPLVDSRQLSFPINLLKTDIVKINDANVPSELNYPQIIGRFRVLKTDILKIDIDNLSIENYKIFQNHLRDIVVSYNAFVNIMNLEVTKDNNEDFMKD